MHGPRFPELVLLSKCSIYNGDFLFLPAPCGKSTRENVLGLSKRQVVLLLVVSDDSSAALPMENLFLGKKRIETLFLGKKRCELHLEMTGPV